MLTAERRPVMVVTARRITVLQRLPFLVVLVLFVGQLSTQNVDKLTEVQKPEEAWPHTPGDQTRT